MCRIFNFYLTIASKMDYNINIGILYNTLISQVMCFPAVRFRVDFRMVKVSGIYV